MKRKVAAQIRAISLRRDGHSVNDIALLLGVAKSSVSSWVRDVRVSNGHRVALMRKGHTPDVIAKRVKTRLKNEKEKRLKIIQGHSKSFPLANQAERDIQLICTGLYWGEGGKSEKNRIFSFTNSDPDMIRTMRTFIDTVLQVSPHKLRGHIHLHPHQDITTAEKYWSRISGIPTAQLYKTTTVVSSSSKGRKTSLKYGTFSIQICSADLYLKMMSWIESAGILTRST